MTPTYKWISVYYKIQSTYNVLTTSTSWTIRLAQEHKDA